jgi:glycosyltransferase involved in cell wall biosynthesis
MSPAITIVSPCFNAARYIEKTLASVATQSLTHFEHVVVDDGSTDTSASVIEGYANRMPRLQLVRSTNGGCASARNRGFRQASLQSKYLLFLDADDLLAPEALQVMVEYMDSHPKVGLAYCDFDLIDAADQPLGLSTRQAGWGPRYVPTRFGVGEIPADIAATPFESVFCITSIIPSVCFLRRSVFEQTPGWDEQMGVIYEDVSLYLHMALRSEVHFVPQKLVKYRRHSTQASTNGAKFAENERKLYDNWKNMPGLTPEQDLRVRRAAWFRDGRVQPMLGLHQAGKHFRQGHLLQAGRYFGGAAKRYAGSFFNKPH